MKLMWIVNVKLPIIYKIQNQENRTNVGGWLDRISKGIIKKKDVTLLVCYPSTLEEEGYNGNFQYHGIPYSGVKMRLGTLDDNLGIEQSKKIIDEFKPDVIHIHGTEFQYSYYFAKAAETLGLADRIVVSIQGLVSIYAEHITLGVPEKIVRAANPKEKISRKNIASNKSYFQKRGRYEENTIRITHHVIGRTSWDRACTYRINPKAIYHFGNETLREEFYTGQWSVDKCVKQRIFISQAGYPVKGFHLFLNALKDIKKFYPDVTVHVAGTDLTKGSSLDRTAFADYILKLMKEFEIEDCVQFCGNLSAEQIKQEMLEANVFISPSTIENSPNSVGEAMLLGVPVVSSYVGGVPDLLQHEKEGFLYPCDEYYMLAYYVNKVFADDKLADELGEMAKKRAEITHNYEKNLNDMLDIYTDIMAS